MDTVEGFKTRAEKIVEAFRNEIQGVRANRPSAALVEDIKVEYYGASTPLKHVSSISVHPPRELHVQVWDKEALKSVISAIESSDLGLSTNVEGNVIKIFLPELSEERRNELIRHIKKTEEEFRIQIRTLRDEVKKEIDTLFDKNEISEDDKFRLREELQKGTEKANKNIEEAFKNKEKEITS